jgi:Uma2 family endonuclease
LFRISDFELRISFGASPLRPPPLEAEHSTHEHGQHRERREDTVTNPVVLVEVLSDATRNYYRGDKFVFYQAIVQPHWLL